MLAQLAIDTVTVAVAAAPTPAPFDMPAANPPPGLDTFGTLLLGWMKWILLACGAGGFIACGIQMTVGRRNRSAFAADGAAGIPWVLAGLTCGAVAMSVVLAILPS